MNASKIIDFLKKAEQIGNQVKALYDDVKLFINIIKQWRAGRFKVEPSQILIILTALTYVINPFDAIPDFIPGFGYSDDITALGLAVKQLASLISQFKSYQKSREEQSKASQEKQSAKEEQKKEDEINDLLQKSREKQQQQKLIKKLMQQFQRQNRKIIQQQQIDHHKKMQQLKKSYEQQHQKTIFITFFVIIFAISCMWLIK